ncbi:hypothetical protein [Streptomyces sp. NBC_00519]|uniref:hypothetical protein n=1 Tax=Streptomyces sp. NBC_00519 TaxID=2975764 RepID=UPI0030DF2A7F
MACCGGARGCTCTVTASSGVEVEGNGSTSNPYVVSSTGAVAATGCGLTGDGSAGAPLSAAVGTWPYACDVDAQGGGVYCDSSGALRTDPPVRQDNFQNSLNEIQATPIPVPTAPTQTIRTLTMTVTNPDPCRPAVGILFREVDLDFDLPPGAGAMAGIDGDDMNYFANGGDRTIFAVHSQDNKITPFALSPGQTRTFTMNIEAGRGSNGADISRIQATLRAWVYSNAQ